MNSFQNIFEETIKDLPEILTRRIIKNKYEEQGLKLTKKKILEISEQLNNSSENIVEFEINKKDVIPSQRKNFDREFVNNIDIEFTKKDFNNFSKDLNKHVKKIYTDSVSDLSKMLFRQLKADTNNFANLQKSDRARFQLRLGKTWKKPFLLFEAFLGLIVEAGKEVLAEYSINSKNEDIVLEVLIQLHARASQVGYEVLALMEAGFADGAHARWRTLHEIAVTCQFISKHGKDVAERYLDHKSVENYKASLQYQEYTKVLKLRRLSKKDLNEIQINYDNALKKHGNNFKESYGWAAAALGRTGKSRLNFSDIEKDVKLDKLRPYYKLASHNIHANANGILYKLGLIDGSPKVLLAGASSYGFTDAAQGAAISLIQVTSTLLLKDSNIDKLVLMNVMSSFKDLVSDEFFKVQTRIEKKYGGNK